MGHHPHRVFIYLFFFTASSITLWHRREKRSVCVQTLCPVVVCDRPFWLTPTESRFILSERSACFYISSEGNLFVPEGKGIMDRRLPFSPGSGQNHSRHYWVEDVFPFRPVCCSLRIGCQLEVLFVFSNLTFCLASWLVPRSQQILVLSDIDGW